MASPMRSAYTAAALYVRFGWDPEQMREVRRQCARRAEIERGVAAEEVPL